MDASEVWMLFFETHLILDIRATFTLKNPNCKNFWWNYNKSESYKPYLGNKEQKLMFLVVCQSDVHIEFDFVSPFFFFFFFACPIGRANKIVGPKNRARRSKFVQPCKNIFFTEHLWVTASQSVKQIIHLLE